MIKTKELRIGNLIELRTNDDKLVGIEMVKKLEGEDFGYGKLPNLDNYPILLTEKWLFDFGFKKGDNKRINDCFYWIMVGSSEFSINPNNGVVWIENKGNVFNNPALIEYVHQLQNLYFALTGEELIIKN